MALKPITQQSANRICCLIISKYGMGKTSLIRTIHGQSWDIESGSWTESTSDEKVCVLSAESGLLAVRDLVTAGIVEGYEISSLADFKEAYQLLLNSKEMQERYPWIFIDSLSEISDRCVEAMKDKYPKKEDSFKLWGDYTDTMKAIVKGFRDIPNYNVVFTSLETIDKDENNKRYIAPAVAGKEIKEKLPSYFDEVFYLQSLPGPDGKDQRIFYTQPWNEYPAKDRSGKLEAVEYPNLLAIKNKILS